MNNSFIKGLFTGLFISIVVFSSIAATGFIHWDKMEVKPVCYVTSSIGGFSPVDGNSIGNVWSKDEVLPICIVKPSFAGFIPIEGTQIGNTWSREEVVPMCSVKPSIQGFIPVER